MVGAFKYLSDKRPTLASALFNGKNQHSLRKQPFLLVLRRWHGDVSHGGTSASLQQKFHTDDVNQCLHNKSGSYGLPRLSWSILVKCCLHLREGSSKSIYSTNIDCIVRDSSRLHLTFVAFCRSFVKNS